MASKADKTITALKKERKAAKSNRDKAALSLANSAAEIANAKKKAKPAQSTVIRVERTEAEKLKNGHLNTLQSEAADRFYLYYYGAQMATNNSELREVVDCSFNGVSIPDRVIECQGKLAEASRRLGMVSYTVVHKFVAEGQTAKAISLQLDGSGSDRVQWYYRKLFRDSLTELADLWMPAKSKPKRHNPQNTRVPMFGDS